MSEEKIFPEEEEIDVDDISDNENEDLDGGIQDDLELSDGDNDDDDDELGDIEEGLKNPPGSESLSNVEYYDTDTDDEDEEEFDKLNNTDLTVDLLNEHPEYISHNIKEVNALCNVIRDSQGNIIDELHKTIPFVTRYEKAKILGERSKQLSYSNVEPMIKVPPDIIDSYEIAKLEYNANMIPFIIKRNLPDGSCEYWRFKDLEKILFD